MKPINNFYSILHSPLRVKKSICSCQYTGVEDFFGSCEIQAEENHHLCWSNIEMMRSRFRTTRKSQAIETNSSIGKTLLLNYKLEEAMRCKIFTTFISHREGKRKAMESLTNVAYFHVLLPQDVKHLYTSELLTLNKKIFHVG